MWGKTNKYKNSKTERSGRSFDSKFEAAVFDLFSSAVVQQQECIYLTKAKILYKPDFTCEDPVTKEKFWVEAKGYETSLWRLKLKLWRHYGPGPLHIYKGDYKKPIHTETVIPELYED